MQAQACEWCLDGKTKVGTLFKARQDAASDLCDLAADRNRAIYNPGSAVSRVARSYIRMHLRRAGADVA